MPNRIDLQKRAEKKITDNIALFYKEIDETKDINPLMVYDEFKKSGFIEITPPKGKKPKIKFPEMKPGVQYMITIDNLESYHSGHSIKPGNIKLNLKKLIAGIPSIIELTISIATDIPILKICTALNVWKSVLDICTVPISKEQAFVIVALWKNCNSQNVIEAEQGYIAVNTLLKKYGESEITEIKYNKLLDSLEAIQCIELREESVFLKESINKKYIHSI